MEEITLGQRKVKTLILNKEENWDDVISPAYDLSDLFDHEETQKTAKNFEEFKTLSGIKTSLVRSLNTWFDENVELIIIAVDHEGFFYASKYSNNK